MTWPKPSLQDVGDVFSGQTVTGYVCFQIAANDARTLKLYTGNSPSLDELIHLTGTRRVFFALQNA